MIFFVPLLFLCTAFLSVYFYLTRNYNYWKVQNVPYAANPTVGFGHASSMIFLRENFGGFIDKLYKKMGKRSMYGCYLLQTPALLIRDPALIKKVLQKDFSSFRNNMFTVNEKFDPIISKNPFFANDEVWKESRILLGNNFSGKKMRYVFANVVRVCDISTNYIDSKMNEKLNNSEIELKDLFSRIIGEIMANSAFGIEGQSFENTLDNQSFTANVRNMFDPTTSNGIRQIILFFLPQIANLIGTSFVPPQFDVFVRRHLKTFVESLKLNGQAKHDCFQFSVDEIGKVDDNMLIAQATSIIFDGYETSSIAIAFMIYHLAENSFIQNKAREEVNAALEKFGDKLTYEAVKSMDYLEKVLLETLRVNPAFGDFSRVCTEKIVLEGYDKLSCELKPGHIVLMAPSCLHMDEEFWSNPTVFDPERFNHSNKSSRNRYTYLGFGEGPRICPGMRLGAVIVKTVTAMILKRYSLELSDRSKGPLKNSPNSFSSQIEGGLWVKFKKLSVVD